MQDEEFEWDDEKNRKNLKLHHVSFYEAKYVFNDPLKLIIPDITHGEEERWIAVGLAEKPLFVVYTERGKRKRLITARIATKAEEEIYNDCNI